MVEVGLFILLDALTVVIRDARLILAIQTGLVLLNPALTPCDVKSNVRPC